MRAERSGTLSPKPLQRGTPAMFDHFACRPVRQRQPGAIGAGRYGLGASTARIQRVGLPQGSNRSGGERDICWSAGVIVELLATIAPGDPLARLHGGVLQLRPRELQLVEVAARHVRDHDVVADRVQGDLVRAAVDPKRPAGVGADADLQFEVGAVNIGGALRIGVVQPEHQFDAIAFPVFQAAGVVVQPRRRSHGPRPARRRRSRPT